MFPMPPPTYSEHQNDRSADSNTRTPPAEPPSYNSVVNSNENNNSTGIQESTNVIVRSEVGNEASNPFNIKKSKLKKSKKDKNENNENNNSNTNNNVSNNQNDELRSSRL